MLRRSKEYKKLKGNKAQSLLEYSMLLGLAAMVLYTMGPFIRRSLQAMIKVAADQVGAQENADQAFDEGYLNASEARSAVSVKKGYRERAGLITYEHEDRVFMQTRSDINMGFQEAEDDY